MLDLEYLKQHPQSATPDQVLELIRLVELSRSTLPDYSEAEAEAQAQEDDGAIGDIKSMPR
jgi:hypothetical protein